MIMLYKHCTCTTQSYMKVCKRLAKEPKCARVRCWASLDVSEHRSAVIVCSQSGQKKTMQEVLIVVLLDF